MNETVRDAVEDLALQLSNLWDDTELVDQARNIFQTIYSEGRPVEMDADSLRHNIYCLRVLVDRVRDWADMTEEAALTVYDVLVAEV